jgi:hypothetical protein
MAHNININPSVFVPWHNLWIYQVDYCLKPTQSIKIVKDHQIIVSKPKK